LSNSSAFSTEVSHLRKSLVSPCPQMDCQQSSCFLFAQVVLRGCEGFFIVTAVRIHNLMKINLADRQGVTVLHSKIHASALLDGGSYSDYLNCNIGM